MVQNSNNKKMFSVPFVFAVIMSRHSRKHENGLHEIQMSSFVLRLEFSSKGEDNEFILLSFGDSCVQWIA